MRLYEPSVLDQIVLALIGEKPRHGFAVSKELETDPSLSAVIRARRPLVYRSINSLVDAKLIRETKTEPGDQGSPRVIYAATATGKSTTNKWLNDTVDHPRDARIELLAKFVLRNRRAMKSKQLATRQRKLFERQAANLQVAANSATDDVRLVALWRVENINAMIRLLDVVVKD
jgi:DNA-binding PadR family transcriptional regulator